VERETALGGLESLKEVSGCRHPLLKGRNAHHGVNVVAGRMDRCGPFRLDDLRFHIHRPAVLC